MTYKKKRRAKIGAIPAAVALALPTAALGQADADGIAVESGEVVEEIVVTGSRLARRDFTAPSPITSIDRETLAFSGQQTLESTLNRMPQLTPDFDRTSNNPGNGTARINLRGMGAGRTLVMLNGRRLAPSGIGSAVDANNLPQALIERVEIITGGASTVYGSDAIAGVVNVITRSDYEGFGLDMSAYVTEKGDSNTYDINASWGHNFANGKGNITVFGGYYNREPSFQADRAFTRVPLFENWDTGELEESGSFTVPSGLTFFFTGNPPPDDFAPFTWDPAGNPVPFNVPDDLYNYAPVNYLQIPLERYSGGVFLNYELGRNLETYVELTHTRKIATQNLAPVPAANFSLINSDNPILTPATRQLIEDNFFPATGAIPGIDNLYAGPLRRRLLELGPRIFENEDDYSRAVVGLRGDITENWDFDFWVTYTKGDETEAVINAASRSRYEQGFLVDPATGECYDPSNGCVPINIFGEGNITPEAVAFLRLPTLFNTTSRTQKLASFFVRGEPFSTWAGPVGTAIGVEWRKDEGSLEADELLFTGDALGAFPDPSVIGEESVTEVYAEAIVPLAEDAFFGEYLGLELGARYSEYEHAGKVDSYKLGGDWQINSTLRFRAMFQRSVRAPNLAEAFEEQRFDDGAWVSFQPSNDLCSAAADPVGSGNADACIATGLPASQLGVFEAQVQFPTVFISGGNPNLNPETAETVTVGVIVTPEWWPNWQVSIDYFDLNVEDEIGGLAAETACFDSANVDNLFCDRIRRDPLTFNVNEVDETNINRGILETRGVDTQISFSSELPDYLGIGNNSADLVVNSTWTRMFSNSAQPSAFGTILDCAGYFGWPCNDSRDGNTWPRDRVTTTFNYASGDLNLFLTWQWIANTKNSAPLGVPIFGYPEPDLAVPVTGVKNYLDLGVGYQFTDKIVGRLAISNLTDTTPPQMADSAGANNTDTALYDIFGRSYTLSFSLQY
jgi:outer membrane receptor protein involved in Fe transport